LEPTELFAFAHCAAFHSRSAARAVTQHFDDYLQPSELRITQVAILFVIKVAGALPMQALAQKLHLDPSTLTRTLQPLERDNLIRIEEGEDDRRRRDVVLTAAGHRRFEQAFELWQKAQAEVRQRLGAERFDRLISDLAALTAALSSP
jgi:DNA-binding MarR family transcriptional regulator